MRKLVRELIWIEELLPSGCIRKPLFGGFSYYLENRLVLALFEKNGDRKFKNKTYDIELWNGCFFPMEREQHLVILKKFPFLVQHPVLPKWLYLPTNTENFESYIELLIKEIRKRNLSFGIIPKPKNKKKSNSNRKALNKLSFNKNEIIDTKRPRMFAEEADDIQIHMAKRLTDLKNIGPVSECVFKKAGIKSVQQFLDLGWKASMKKLAQSNSRNVNTLFAYAVIGALKNQHWNRIAEQDKIQAREFVKKLKISC